MTDTHVELYKRYRPTTWRGLIGQEKLAKSLQNAINANKLPTSYLFAGPRGCGKTSAALLMAKAINCLDPSDQSDPCNKCDVCVAIDEKRQLGVNYISMANKGSVEDVRKIVSDARSHQPVKRQVWILDEVHNLSKSAFDALLIPLEELGMPSLFIFCTTEVDRVPQTVLSRVQQRRFNLVSSKLMLKFIKRIGQLEELTIEEDDYKNAVREGRGSVRDTLTALETIVETGESSQSYEGELLEALASQELSSVLAVVAKANTGGQDGRDLSDALFSDLRDLLLTASGVDESLVGIVPVMDPESVVKQLLGKRGIMLVMDEIGAGITQMTMGADSRIHFEISLVKSLSQLRKLRKALEARAQ